MITQAVSYLAPGQGKRALTEDELLSVEDVLDASTEWAAGRLPWNAAATVGTIIHRARPSSSYTRFVALWKIPIDDPRRLALLDLVDEIVAKQGVTVTHQGAFTAQEAHQHDASAEWIRRAPRSTR